MTQSVRTRAIPVLAYSTSDAASPRLCNLVFKYNGARSQATLTLQSTMPISGLDGAQTFTLQYDADNLTASSLGPAAIPLPQTRLDDITRQGSPQIRTLFLRLKKPCPLWCPPSSGKLFPAPGAQSIFFTIASLARATEVDIVLDYNWLHRDYHGIFRRFIEQPETLTGFPNGFADRYRRTDWTVFSSVSDTDGDKVLVEVEEAPPSYVEASHKRVRRESTSPPSTPERKRILFSPAHIPTSPTEKASTTSSPSPKPLRSPPTSAQDLQNVVERVLATLLPDALGRLLPDLLPRLLVSKTSSPSPSAASSYSASTSQTAIAPAPLSSLGTTLSAHVARQVESQLQSIYSQTLSHAAFLRNTADVEFFEAVEDHKIDMMLVKEDTVSELEKATVDRLQFLREEAEDVVEEVCEWIGDAANGAYDDAKEKIDGLQDSDNAKMSMALQRGGEDLRRERGWLRWERQVFERERRQFEARVPQVERNSHRASSTPL